MTNDIIEMPGNPNPEMEALAEVWNAAYVAAVQVLDAEVGDCAARMLALRIADETEENWLRD